MQKHTSLFTTCILLTDIGPIHEGLALSFAMSFIKGPWPKLSSRCLLSLNNIALFLHILTITNLTKLNEIVFRWKLLLTTRIWVFPVLPHDEPDPVLHVLAVDGP